MNYREALAWLYGLQRFGIKLGLDNTRRLFRALNVPRASGKIIHVAGTNGKGSVCAMIDSILREAGYHVGLYTSPHLVTFRERIRVNGEMISEEAVAAGLTEIREITQSWEPHPTFFEVTTALALRCFEEAKIDILVLETGLGGRLDATNAIRSDVAVITPIALDHEKWLGDSIEKIATEKAGIIKSGRPVVSSAQNSDAERVLRKRAAGCGASIEFVTQPHTKSGALSGRHQKHNAALAIAAIRAAKIDKSQSGSDLPEAMDRGLDSVEWPARFQRWDARTIIDGAHNPSGAATLAQVWRDEFGDQRGTLILAVLNDKDAGAIARALAPITEKVLLPKIRTARAIDPSVLASKIVDVIPDAQICASLSEALELARSASTPILITGSLHFAGEALALLQNRPAAFEECAQ